MENKLRARYLTAIALFCTGLSGMLQASYTLTNHSNQNLKVRLNGGNNKTLNINSSVSVPASTGVTILTNISTQNWNTTNKTSGAYEIVSYTGNQGRDKLKVQAIQS